MTGTIYALQDRYCQEFICRSDTEDGFKTLARRAFDLWCEIGHPDTANLGVFLSQYRPVLIDVRELVLRDGWL